MAVQLMPLKKVWTGGAVTERLVAFADESVRVTANPPIYLIAATIIPENADLSPLEAILPHGATKLHWRDLGRRAQRESLSRIKGIGSRSTIVIASPIDPKKQERARRKDLEALLPLLEAEGVSRMVMEKRFPAADERDAAHFRALRRRGFISSIELHFADPSTEHRLWVPDQVLGAWGEDFAGNGSQSWKHEWDALRDSVTVVKVPM